MADIEQFRAETRAWLEGHCPQSMRQPVTSMDDHMWGGRQFEFSSEDQKIWFEAMRDKGWICPDWPVEYGGAGLAGDELLVLKEELRRINARPAHMNLGIFMAGPVILEFGTEAQKQEHLPKIARGEIRWCQGYSEPGAGSDLAGLSCKAVRDGDDWVINGSKIWTSYANKSDWIYCLVLSDPEAPKRHGISFLLFDMASEGVSTKPIELTNGESHFCQTFFDNVRVPVSSTLGEINKGWTVAKRVLEHERAMMAEIEESAGRPEDNPVEIAKEHMEFADGKMLDSVMRNRIAKHLMNSDAFELTMQRVGDEFAAQDPLAGMAAVIAKYYGTEEDKRKYQLIQDIMGTYGLVWENGDEHSDQMRIPRQLLSTYAHTIAGGTSEVQLNIIAKRVLGLPD